MGPATEFALALLIGTGAASHGPPTAARTAATAASCSAVIQARKACGDIAPATPEEARRNVSSGAAAEQVIVRNPDGIVARATNGGAQLRRYAFGDGCELAADSKLDERARDGCTVIVRVSETEPLYTRIQHTCPVGTLLLMPADDWDAMVKMNSIFIHLRRRRACEDAWLKSYVRRLLGPSLLGGDPPPVR